VSFSEQPALPLIFGKPKLRVSTGQLREQLAAFSEFGQTSALMMTSFADASASTHQVETFVNEFWTAKQRAANALHEISYRACFKPQLPRFFIERLTDPGDIVYDPFMGRGTTPLEAALLGRIPAGCDVNPLSAVLTRPRLCPPTLGQVEERLSQINLTGRREVADELLVFFHPETLSEIAALKEHFLQRSAANDLDPVDEWIRMVAINRLTGHSPGFFSVYTLPPNQATSVIAQRKINANRGQVPPRRFVGRIILRKTSSLLKECDRQTRDVLGKVNKRAMLLTQGAASTPQIGSNTIALVVTSPPFLDVVDYAGDNWLRCWFLGIDAKTVPITKPSKLDTWMAAMTAVFHELYRILRPGGHVAFEVGEVRAGKLKLEEAVLPCSVAAGFTPVCVVINDQKFTKTANCWGIENGAKGTNTNRIVVLRKAD
jgi:hypothetical protein